MKTFVIANQKGGVGKTTTVLNLGAGLAKAGKSVLLIDLDPQANLSSGVGFDTNQSNQTIQEETSSNYKSIYDVLINKEKISSVYVATDTPNLYLVPSHLSLAGAEVEMVNILARETILQKAIEQIPKGSFDYILIDCPPSLGLLTINALTSADYVIIPIQCEYFALEGLGQLLQTLELIKGINPKLKIGGVLLTMFDSRTKLSQNVVEEVKKYFKDLVFETIVPRNIRLSEAPSHGVSVIDYDPKSAGAQSYLKLAKEFIKRFDNTSN